MNNGDIRKQYEKATGKEWVEFPVTHGEKGYASWLYQAWLEERLIMLSATPPPASVGTGRSAEDAETFFNKHWKIINEGQKSELLLSSREIDGIVSCMQSYAQNKTAGEKEGWVRVEDRLPERENTTDGSSAYVLCMSDSTGIGVPFVAWYSHIENKWTVAHHFATSEAAHVTHWQPLPPAPKEEQKRTK